ncbi:MAG: hypothetical protein HRT90_07800 [Candidatus Margulisbacteria bacterium]|nr:hypothetical protein [Candidatus Margulisiibacteriota bacterium]
MSNFRDVVKPTQENVDDVILRLRMTAAVRVIPFTLLLILAICGYLLLRPL